MTRLESRLFPFQVEGVKALLSQPALLLADEMGLGKTLQSISAVKSLLESGVIQSALVVAPAGLLRQWRAELDRWAPNLSVLCLDGDGTERNWKWGLSKQVYLIGYETLRNDLGRASKIHWDLVILDEAQRIKNRDAAISRACKSLIRARAWALTGTPLENNEGELGSVLEFVRPNQPGVKSLPILPGPRLRNIHGQLQLRRRKSDVLKELPPKTIIRVGLPMTASQRCCYKEVETGLSAQLQRLGPSVTVINVLQVISKLKEICNFCPQSGESSKLVDLRRRLDTLSRAGQRALIFSQWKNEKFGIGRLAKELLEFRPLSYSGSLSLQQREARAREFQTSPDYRVMLISLRAGGQGLNLQAASYVFHFDRWWNPAVENQATDRAHRMGQVNPVTVYCYTTLDSIEERIEKILDAKLALFADIVDGVSLDPRKLMTPAELYSLFGLAPPPPKGSQKAVTATDLVKRAADVLQRNRWQIKSVTQLALQAERFDEMGFHEILHAMHVSGNTPFSAIAEFLEKSADAKRVFLVSHDGKDKVADLVGDLLPCWDEASLSLIEDRLGG